MFDLDVGAHALKDGQQPGPRRIQSDIFDADLGRGVQHAQDEPERGRREITRHSDVDAPQGRTRCQAQPAIALKQVGAHRPQQPFSVVARRRRLDDPGFAVGEQPGQQQRRLDLGAGDLQPVLDPPQTRNGRDRQGGQTPAVSPVYLGPSAAERLDNACHRPLPQRTTTNACSCPSCRSRAHSTAPATRATRRRARGRARHRARSPRPGRADSPGSSRSRRLVRSWRCSLHPRRVR